MNKLLRFPLSSKTWFRTNIRTTDHKLQLLSACLKDDLKWSGILLKQNNHGLYISEKGLHYNEYF